MEVQSPNFTVTAARHILLQISTLCFLTPNHNVRIRICLSNTHLCYRISPAAFLPRIAYTPKCVLHLAVFPMQEQPHTWNSSTKLKLAIFALRIDFCFGCSHYLIKTFTKVVMDIKNTSSPYKQHKG